MKTLSILSLAIISILTFSCKKDSQSGAAVSTVETQKTLVASSSWKVTLYTERAVDYTSDFSKLQFTFSSNGTAAVASTVDTTVFRGIWTLIQKTHSSSDDSGHNSGSEDFKFTIMLSGNARMSEISEDWAIVKLTETEMWLMDDNLDSPKVIHFVKG